MPFASWLTWLVFLQVGLQTFNGCWLGRWVCAFFQFVPGVDCLPVCGADFVRGADLVGGYLLSVSA